MSAHSESAEVVVIGGGLIGCAIAFELAGRGHQATVVERGLPAQAASWAGAGMLSPVGESGAHESFLTLARASLAAYPAFLETLTESTGLGIEFNAPGKIEVAFSEAEAAQLRRLHAAPGAQPLSPAQTLQLEPALNSTINAAVRTAEDALVDNRALGEALWQAAQRRGVAFQLGQPALSLRIDRARVTGVQLGSGAVNAEKVVIAAGAWSGLLAGLPHALPVTPVRGQMIALRHLPQLFHSILQSQRCYLIPRANGRVLVGATVERVGFDARTTASGLQSLLSAALELVPALAGAEVSEHWTGFRPGTPDDLPILGHDPAIQGLFYATGHYRNGILLTPITGILMADLLEGREPFVALEAFRPHRFGHE